LILATLLFAAVAAGQHRRDSWKLKPVDLDARTNPTLADAPLTDTERARIFQAIEKEQGEPSSRSDREEQRQAIMNFLVAPISLAQDGSKQIVVRGSKDYCGATGNCSMWIFVVDFVRQGGGLRVALSAEGQILIVPKTFTLGFHDITIGLHDSATEELYGDFRWDGVSYRQVDCYLTQYPIDGPRPARPKIVSCK
jgi:hypothetical protein